MYEIKIYSILQFSIQIKMAEGINDFLNLFFLGSGTVR